MFRDGWTAIRFRARPRRPAPARARSCVRKVTLKSSLDPARTCHGRAHAPAAWAARSASSRVTWGWQRQPQCRPPGCAAELSRAMQRVGERHPWGALDPGPHAQAAPPVRGARRPRRRRAAPTAPRRRRRADGAPRAQADNPGLWNLHCHTDWHLYMGQKIYFWRPPSASRRRPPASPSAPPRARTTLPPGRPRPCSSCLARPATRRAGRRARRCAG